MRPRWLIALALVVAALAAFIYFFERDLPTLDERREQRDRVFVIESDAVTSLTLERPGVETVELRRAATDSADAGSGRDWHLVRPFDFRADSPAVEWLVDTLTGLRHERVLETFDAEELGLEAPRARISLVTEDEAASTLAIGSPIPGFTSVAVRVDDRPEALVVADALWEQLDKAPGEWRSRQVLPAVRDEVSGVAWSIDGEPFELARRNGELGVVAPFEDVAEEGRVAALLTALTSLRAERFLAANEAPPTPAEAIGPPERLRLQLEDRVEPFELELAPAEAEGELVLHYEGQRATARSELLEALAGPAGTWRSPRWTSLDAWSLERISVRTETDEMALEHLDDTWTRDGDEVPRTAVTDLLDAVVDARGDTVRPRPDGWSPPGEPILRLELHDAAGSSETLKLYADGTAATSARTVLLEIPEATRDRIEARLAALLAAE